MTNIVDHLREARIDSFTRAVLTSARSLGAIAESSRFQPMEDQAQPQRARSCLQAAGLHFQKYENEMQSIY